MSNLEDQKICVTCGKTKPLTEFYKFTRDKKESRYSVCRDCYLISRRKTKPPKQILEQHPTANKMALVGKFRCGGCGKTLKKPTRNHGWLCDTCGASPPDKAEYVEHYRKVMKTDTAILSCPTCAFVQLCEMRVKLGLWTVCEIPDRGDLERAEAIGIQTDGHNIFVDSTLLRDQTYWLPHWPQKETVNVGEMQPITLERIVRKEV